LNAKFLSFFVFNINIDLSVPYVFASLEKMIIDYPINKIKNKKKKIMLHIYIMKLK
jgi:hypothetical protein